MGTTEIYTSERPKPKEIVRLVISRMEGDNLKVIDRSGLINFSRMYLLFEKRTPGASAPEHRITRFIAHVSINYAEQSLIIRETDESQGIQHLDCPNRLIRQAELGPPLCPRSTEWRSRVRSHNANRSQLERIFRTLDQLPVNDDTGRRIVLTDGRVVRYRKGRGQGRRLRAYEDGNSLRQLKPADVDTAATLQLMKSRREQ